MLENEQAPSVLLAPEGGSSTRSDVIPPQSDRNVGFQTAQPTSQLTELAHLGELAGQPINLYELLMLSEDELLSMYRGLRCFVDNATGVRAANSGC